MKNLILIGMTLLAISAFGADKNASRKVAQQDDFGPGQTFGCQHMGLGPVIECSGGRIVEDPKTKCNHCEMEPSCIKVPTLTCVTGFHDSEDAKGCYHCAKDEVMMGSSAGTVDRAICWQSNPEAQLNAYKYQAASAYKSLTKYKGKVPFTDIILTNGTSSTVDHDPNFTIKIPGQSDYQITCDDSGDDDCFCSAGSAS